MPEFSRNHFEKVGGREERVAGIFREKVGGREERVAGIFAEKVGGREERVAGIFAEWEGGMCHGAVESVCHGAVGVECGGRNTQIPFVATNSDYKINVEGCFLGCIPKHLRAPPENPSKKIPYVPPSMDFRRMGLITRIKLPPQKIPEGSSVFLEP